MIEQLGIMHLNIKEKSNLELSEPFLNAWPYTTEPSNYTCSYIAVEYKEKKQHQ